MALKYKSIVNFLHNHVEIAFQKEIIKKIYRFFKIMGNEILNYSV